MNRLEIGRIEQFSQYVTRRQTRTQKWDSQAWMAVLKVGWLQIIKQQALPISVFPILYGQGQPKMVGMGQLILIQTRSNPWVV